MMRPRGVAAAAALLVTILAPLDGARGHGRSRSFSSWELESAGARVRMRVAELDLSRLPFSIIGTPGGVAAYLGERLSLSTGGVACRVEPPRRLDAGPGAGATGWRTYEWRVACPAQEDLVIRSAILGEVSPSHLHFSRVRLPDGTLVEKVLSELEPEWKVARPGAGDGRWSATPTSLGSYVRLGIAHILSGWDHLAFVLALLLLAGSVAEVAALVTAFTLAHSVTLALAALGWVQPEQPAVEALIGFSIALVAAENVSIAAGHDRTIPLVVVLALLVTAALAAAGVGALSPVTVCGLALFSLCHFGLLRGAERPARLRAAVAFAFGLVHGFGFAGVLSELDLASGRLLPALFGFNVGVEVGQLAAVVLVWPCMRLLGRVDGGRWQRLAAEAGSAAICALGVFWFVSRTFG